MLFPVTIFISVFICLSFSKGLPSFLPRCHIDDPELSKCVLRAFNQIRPYATNGIEEIGLPSLNPFVIPKMTVSQDTPMANYTLTVTNVTSEGLKNYDIKEFQYDPETMTYHFRIEFDRFPINGFYEINGHIAHVPLEGKGFATSVFGPVNAVFQIKGSMRKSNGIDYYNTKDVSVDLNIADGSFYFEGLFDNNLQLERMANEMLNSNSVMVAEALTPMFEDISRMGVMRFMKTLTKIPFFKLFPPSH